MANAHALEEDCRPIVEEMIRQGGAKAIAVASSYGDGADRIFLDSPKCDFDFRVTHTAVCLKMRSAMIYAIVFYCPESQMELDTYGTSFHSVSNLLEAFLKA